MTYSDISQTSIDEVQTGHAVEVERSRSEGAAMITRSDLLTPHCRRRELPGGCYCLPMLIGPP
jgi:hypothetical protein